MDISVSPSKDENNSGQVVKNTQASTFPYSSDVRTSHWVMYKVTDSRLMGRCPFVLHSSEPSPAVCHLRVDVSSEGTYRRYSF